MNSNKQLASGNSSQWSDIKVTGGSKQELTRVVAQIRAQVRDERKIFSSSSVPSSDKKNSQK